MIKKTGRFLCIVLLLAFYALAAGNDRNASITVDEGLHIASGYTILTTGDYRLVEEHPPLVKLWLALPLLGISDLADPTTLPAWDTANFATTESVPLLRMAQQLLFNNLPVDRWLLPARMMNAMLGVILLSLLFRWASDCWGANGGFLVIMLAAFDPNLIAHSAVAGTDIGAALFILLALWLTGKYLRKTSRRLSLLTGLCTGLALASKLTAVLVLVPLGITWFTGFLRSRHTWFNHILNGCIIIGVMFLTLWGVYSFEIGIVDGFPLSVPMPSSAIPVYRLIEHTSGGHSAYLFGENKIDGWWSYFPLAFLVKTPLAVLLLVPFSLVAYFRQIYRKRALLPVALFTILYVAVSLASTLNIGYRHMLPVLCVLYISLGNVAYLKLKPVLCVLLLILAIFQAGNTAIHTPYLLGWFNTISGGTKNGWRYLADSNTDWGQGYKTLADYQKEHDIPILNLAGFVFYDPGIYNLDSTPLPPMHGNTPAILPNRFAPPPGHYAISMTSLDGIPLADYEMYDWFRWQPPTERIANALHYYHVTQQDVETRWVAQCTTPLTPLERKDLVAGFGTPSLRIIPFDCIQSWIIPELSIGPGAYIIHGSYLQDNLVSKLHYIAPQATDPFIKTRLGLTEIRYYQRYYRENPSFAIYRMLPQTSVYNPEITTVIASSADSIPTNFDVLDGISTPIYFNGPLDFLGLNVNESNTSLEVETWWRVKQIPSQGELISIMAHLINAKGESLGVADGLGIHPTDWMVGDVIIQRHVFDPQTTESSAEFFRTGLYRIADGERFTIKDTDSDAVFVQLQ